MNVQGVPPPEISMDDWFQLVESHRPYLDAGNYLIEVEHEIDTGKGTDRFTAAPMNIYVAGDRFVLPDELVHAVFPAAGSRGIFDHALPHILLNRSTLPWERMPLGKGTIDDLAPSWLALLVFSESEAATIKTHVVSVNDPKDKKGHLTKGPALFGEGLVIEPGQHATDQVTVIDVPLGQLQGILPRYNDLTALTHVRRVSKGADTGSTRLSIRPAEGLHDATGPGEGPAPAVSPELAVVVANRLPPANSTCRVHLVSLERRFRDMDGPDAAPDPQPRAAQMLSSPDLIGWLRKAHEDRQTDGVYGVDLTLENRHKPRLNVIRDRDNFDSEAGDTISQADRLGDDDADGFCLELMGNDAVWHAQLARTGRVQITRPLSDGQDVIGLFQTTVTHSDWKTRPLDPDDIKFLGTFVPELSDSSGADLVVDCPIQPTAELAASLCAWIGDMAQEKLHTQLTKTIQLVPNYGYDTVPEDLHGALDLRSTLRELILTDKRAAKGAERTRLRHAAARVTGRYLSVTFEAHGLKLGARLKPRTGGLDITLSGRAPRMKAVVRALRNEPVFGTGDETAKDLIRLVSLKSWSFYNQAEERSFAGELLDLNPEGDADGDRNTEAGYLATSGAFHLPLPAKVEGDDLLEAGRAYLQAGSVPLQHSTRNGETTMSWYRGPFVATGFKPHELPLPARGPDELLIWDDEIGMLDVSYAAAWELGRLTTLRDNDFAMALFHWKRDHARTLAHLRQRYDYDYLPLHRRDGPSAPPDELAAGFDRLTRLEPVPFNYLVPDEAMLPTDSIRFFDVDPMWLEALRDGAFSIGRVLAKDHLDDTAHRENLKAPRRMTGVLLRSSVVADWADLRVDGYTGIDRTQVDLSTHPTYFEHKLTLERFARLGPSLLLCLFSDPRNLHRPVEMVDIHLPAEVLHSGLEPSATDASRSKRLHDPNNGLPLHVWHQLRADRHKADHTARYLLGSPAMRLLKLAGVSQTTLAALQPLKGQAFSSPTALTQKLPNTDEHLAKLLNRVLCPNHPEEQVIENIHSWKGKSEGVLDVVRLMDEVANRLAPSYHGGHHRFSAADFALQMLDLPPIVRFVRPETLDPKVQP